MAFYDNPGCGLSDAPQTPRTIPEFARDACAVLDALGWDRTRVFGASMGTMIALQLALDEPSRVRSLLLIASYCGWPRMRETDEAWARDLKALEEAAALQPTDPAAAARLFIDAALDDSTKEFHEEWTQVAEEVIRELPTRAPPVFLGDGPNLADWSVHERLHDIAAPTLMFHGVNDRLLPVEGVFEMARRMQRAELHLYNPGNHRAVNPYNAERVVPYIKAWLAQVP